MHDDDFKFGLTKVFFRPGKVRFYLRFYLSKFLFIRDSLVNHRKENSKSVITIFYFSRDELQIFHPRVGLT